MATTEEKLSDEDRTEIVSGAWILTKMKKDEETKKRTKPTLVNS